MKLALLPGIFLGSILCLAGEADAQTCPYDIQFTTYGPPSCTALGFPTLTGSFNGSAACDVTLTYTPVAWAPNVFLVGNALVIGMQTANIPVPSGCPFLVLPLHLVPLPATHDPQVIQATLPPDPGLIGSDYFLQGVSLTIRARPNPPVIKITSPGLQMSIR